MRSFGNLRIGVRLGLAFIFVLLLLVGVVGIGIGRLADVNQELHTVVENRYPKVLLAFEVQNNVNSIVRNVRAVLLERTPEGVKKTTADIAARAKRLARPWKSSTRACRPRRRGPSLCRPTSSARNS